MNRVARGFSLLELMVTVAIVAVLSAIALPLYSSYIETSRVGVLVNNISTIEIFQEDFRLRNGVYSVDHANIAAITAAIGWDPQADDGVTYAIADSDGSFYQVTGTAPSGTVICMRYPDKTVCP